MPQFPLNTNLRVSRQSNYFHRSTQRSLFGDDIKEISAPIVNPFLNGSSLNILNPQDKIPRWLQTDDTKLKDTDLQQATENLKDENKETLINTTKTVNSETSAKKASQLHARLD